MHGHQEIDEYTQKGIKANTNVHETHFKIQLGNWVTGRQGEGRGGDVSSVLSSLRHGGRCGRCQHHAPEMQLVLQNSTRLLW